MEFQTIDQHKIISTQKAEGVVTYTLENGSYLSDSFNCLPNGRIDKRITGIGATYLELTSKRNSIIVEPLKSIASSKAKEHGAIYVGGKTKFHPQVLSDKSLKTLLQNSKNPYVKILVVADSLWKVLNALDFNNSEPDSINDYFLMVDEIDTFQSDSKYRDRLERVMDHYFKFANRCVVSATLKDFTNPKIAQEPLTIIDYETLFKKEISIINSSDKHINHVVTAKIVECCQKEEPVLIAYNYIQGIIHAIELLPPELKDQCGVLCSINSQSKVRDYYLDYDVGASLVQPITFMTCAYFSGIDINTSCHIICVANGNRHYTTLSLDRIRQIHGRVRNDKNGNNNILSNSLIYTPTKPSDKEVSSKEKLLSYATKTLKSLECVKHVYSDDSASLNLMKGIRMAISKSAKISGYNLIRDNANSYDIAYFNIDALLDQQQSLKLLYGSITDLEKQLLKYYNVTEILPSKELVPQNIDDTALDILKENQQQQQLKEINEALGYILETEVFNYPKLIKESHGVTKNIFYQYNKIYPFFEKQKAVEYLKELNINTKKNKPKHDSRDFNYFFQALIFYTLPENHIFKNKILEAFPIGSLYNNTEILSKLNNIYARADIGLMELSTPTMAKRQLKLYFEVIPARKKDELGNTLHKIKAINPKGFETTYQLGEKIKSNLMFTGISMVEKSEATIDLETSKANPHQFFNDDVPTEILHNDIEQQKLIARGLVYQKLKNENIEKEEDDFSLKSIDEPKYITLNDKEDLDLTPEQLKLLKEESETLGEDNDRDNLKPLQL